MDTGDLSSYSRTGEDDASIRRGLQVLADAEVIYGHNSIGFDLPAIKKVYPDFTFKGKHRDTYVIAAARWAHIKEDDWKRVKAGKFPNKKALCGSHSLEAWGYRLGVPKGEYKQWCKDNGIEKPFAVWRPEMQSYCEGDTETTLALVKAIQRAGCSAEMIETELALREYLVGVEMNGVPFDVDKAIAFQGRLSQRREELEELLRQEFGSWTVDLPDFIPKRNDKSKGYVKDVPVKKFKTITFNPKSTDQIADRLTTLYGWKPERFTDGGAPKVDEAAIASLSYPPIPLLQEYLLVSKRLGQLAESKKEGAWLQITIPNPLTGLSHIHGRINQSGTITGRASHSKPNMSAVPKVGKPYGEECRELFYVPPGWVMVGADASGLEARCMAHRLYPFDNGAYGELLLAGDVHTANRIALGLPEGKEFRDRAKTWFYAFVYGAGDEKLGRILRPELPANKHAAIGKAGKALFFKNTPALAILVERVKLKVKNPGYLTGLDGRRVYLRSEHSALNALLQSDGAVIAKRWGVNFSRRLTDTLGPQGWKGSWAGLLWSHDEYQIAAKELTAEYVCRVMVESIESLTEHFKFRCPLTGEAKVGRNWKETH